MVVFVTPSAGCRDEGAAVKMMQVFRSILTMHRLGISGLEIMSILRFRIQSC